MMGQSLAERFRSVKRRVPRIAVERLRMRPAWVGYRWWEKESVTEYLARTGGRDAAYRRIHAEEVHRNPLPRNITSREQLTNTAGWWGYSFWDVPERRSDETFIATLPDCRVVHYIEDDPKHPFVGDFYVGILDRGDRSLELREIRFREKHADILRSSRTMRLPKATWILERVYHNYSHWFTAHMPKLALLKEQGRLDNLVLPHKTNNVIEASLRMLGIDRRDFPTMDPSTPLQVDELTILGTDRFRPELLRSVRDAIAASASQPPHRRVFISRAKAPRRRLVNEGDIWPLLERAGFERVIMEDLSFEAQLELMAETAILFAPHGAGLTNMMFCAPGTHVVEIADLTFPNPNFYAVASAMGHHYWLLSGTPIGNQHPLERDMAADPQEVKQLLKELLAETG